MNHLGPYIVSRTRPSAYELVDTRTGELIIRPSIDDLLIHQHIKPNDLLIIPGTETTTLNDRLIDPSWLSDLRKRRIDYVREKTKKTRRTKRSDRAMAEGQGLDLDDGGASETTPRKRATTRRASKKVQARLTALAADDPIAQQLARLLGSIK